MSEIKVNSIKGVGASAAAITVNNTDGTCTANITSVGGAPLSNRNLCINGADMMVAQRGTSTTGLQNAGGVYTIDRFSHRRNGTWSNAQFKHEQVDSGTGLFKKALKVTCTTAEGSGASGDEGVFIGHYLEKQDTVAAFGDGSAEAKSFTISFYVKASIATTYVLHLTTHHLSTNKLIYKTFVVNSADTWERKTLTFPAITNSVSTVDSTVADNAMSFQIHWILDSAAGSKAVDTYQSGTGTYQMPTGVNPTGFANTLNATFQLSGVQIEAGTVATDLEHRSFGQELALCQRYYYQMWSGTEQGHYFYYYSSNYKMLQIEHIVPMRASPSMTFNLNTGSSSAWTSNEYQYKAYVAIPGSGAAHYIQGTLKASAEL